MEFYEVHVINLIFISLMSFCQFSCIYFSICFTGDYYNAVISENATD